MLVGTTIADDGKIRIRATEGRREVDACARLPEGQKVVGAAWCLHFISGLERFGAELRRRNTHGVTCVSLLLIVSYMCVSAQQFVQYELSRWRYGCVSKTQQSSTVSMNAKKLTRCVSAESRVVGDSEFTESDQTMIIVRWCLEEQCLVLCIRDPPCRGPRSNPRLCCSM